MPDTSAPSADVILPLGLLAAAGFLSSAGARVVDPLLHAIATDFIVTVPQVSVVIAAFTLPYGLNQLILGPVGDRFGKLRVMLGALVGYAVFTGLCALATSLPSLTLMRACAGAASAGLIPVGMAYIGDAVPYGQRQVTLSRFLTGIVLAQTLAGPVGGVFGEYVGWRGVFLVLSGLAVALAVLMARRIRGLPDRRNPGRMINPDNYRRMAANPVSRLVLLAAALDGALFVGCFPYIAPYLHEHFGLNYAHAGLVLACFGLGAWAYTRLARPLLAWLGEGGLILAGGVLIVAGLVLSAVGLSWWRAGRTGAGPGLLHAARRAAGARDRAAAAGPRDRRRHLRLPAVPRAERRGAAVRNAGCPVRRSCGHRGG